MTAAAFLRTDGLSPALEPGRVAVALTRRSRTLVDKLWRTSAAWSSAPLRHSGALDADDAVRLAWLALRGLSEDRLVVVGAQVADELAASLKISPLAEIVERRRRLGEHIVLLTDVPERLARPLFASLRPDTLIANRLEVRGGRLTGRLVEPLTSGRVAGARLHAWAEGAGVDLAHSTAFASRGDDVSLLTSVGNPCAVRPDRRLRGHARRLGWPVEVTR